MQSEHRDLIESLQRRLVDLDKQLEELADETMRSAGPQKKRVRNRLVELRYERDQLQAQIQAAQHARQKPLPALRASLSRTRAALQGALERSLQQARRGESR
ncbi:MAG: hypothetical protein HC915_11555 [Anaerolineae bacterium]|nr:hypothetical protein [Anaerolineae bacterium]